MNPHSKVAKTLDISQSAKISPYLVTLVVDSTADTLVVDSTADTELRSEDRITSLPQMRDKNRVKRSW